MTIERHEGRMQITCDSCPASFAETYAEEDFAIMIADARAAGWRIRKVEAAAAGARDRDTRDLFARAPANVAAEGEKLKGGAKNPQSYTHTCLACVGNTRGSLL